MSDSKTEPSADARPKKPMGNPILRQMRETGVVPDGYYLDAKGKLRKAPEELPDRVDGDFDRLKVMRYVLNNPRSLDKTEGEKAMRAYLEKNPGQFMETYDELVRAESEASEPLGEAVVERSEGDEELHALLDELIGRALEKAARPPRR